jgi:hypothetical protein
LKKINSLILLPLAFAASASANTVTFGSFSPQETCVESVPQDGLTFTDYGYGTPCLGVFSGATNNDGSPDLLFGENPGVPVQITLTGGGAFDLDSFDMTLSNYNYTDPNTVNVTAWFAGGGSSTRTLTLGEGMELYNLDLSDVFYVYVSPLASGSGYWAMDNVTFDTNIASVPEPSEALPLAALFGAGAVTAAYGRKKRTA